MGRVRRPIAGAAYIELHTLVVFIEFSASVRVLNAVFPMTVVVVVVGFCCTIVHFLVDESRTTQYSSAANVGVAIAARRIPPAMAFSMMRSPSMSPA
jgi:hypothetical protein